MAHIKKLGKDKYKATVEVGVKGKRKRRTKIFEKSKDAEVWIANMITDKVDGTLVDTNNITVDEYFEKFLNIYKKPYISTTTYDNYCRRFKKHIKPAFGNYRIQDIKTYHLEEYFEYKRKNDRLDGKGGLSENTLKKIYVLLNQFLKKAKNTHLIKHNPLDPIDSPQPEKFEAQSMKISEFNKLIEVAKQNNYFMYVFITTILYTGLRKSETLGLSWDEIDFDNKTLEVKRRLVVKYNGGSILENETKNKSSKRKIKISDKLISLLKQYRKWQLENRLFLGEEYIGDDIDLIFCRPDGYRFSPNSLNGMMRRLNKKAGLPYKSQIHILRHTFATINVNSKIGPEIVQKMLGHSTVSTTIDIYYHHDTEMQNEAVENLDNTIQI